MNIIYWIIAIVVVVGLVVWCLKSKKGKPEQEIKEPEGPTSPPPTI